MSEIAVIEEHDEPEVTLVPQAGGVFAVRDPGQMIQQATTIANLLKDIVTKAGLVKKIRDKDYLLVEAWTTLGVLVGCTARTEWTRPVENGWEAAVEVVNANGLVIARAEAECLRSESLWKSRDDYALRSMAQTRAMGKALRMPLGWVAVLAGYEATPAEEMPEEGSRPSGGSEARSGAQEGSGGANQGDRAPAKISEAQMRNLQRLVTALDGKIAVKGGEEGATSDDLREIIKREAKVHSMKDLTSRQARDLIDRLKKRAGEES